MIAWRVYYDDGSTFDSSQGGPEDAPGWGVIAIVQPDPRTNRTVLSRWDHYCWHSSDGWYGHDLIGLMDCLAMPGWSAVAHGRTVPPDLWQQINERASNDPDFLPKSATQMTERPRGTSWTLTGRSDA